MVFEYQPQGVCSRLCSATRFLRNADRINEKNEAGKITPQPRSF